MGNPLSDIFRQTEPLGSCLLRGAGHLAQCLPRYAGRPFPSRVGTGCDLLLSAPAVFLVLFLAGDFRTSFLGWNIARRIISEVAKRWGTF